MSRRSWVIETPCKKYLVQYDTFREWLTIDGRHIELVRTGNQYIEDVQLPIDEVTAIFHASGNYADIYVNGQSMNTGKSLGEAVPDRKRRFSWGQLLTLSCLFSGRVYGIAIGFSGFCVCCIIGYRLNSPESFRLRDILCGAVACVCIVVTLLLMLLL